MQMQKAENLKFEMLNCRRFWLIVATAAVVAVWLMLAGCVSQSPVGKTQAPQSSTGETQAQTAVVKNSLTTEQTVFQPDGAGGWNIVPPSNCFVQLETSTDLKNWQPCSPLYFGYDATLPTNYLTVRATNAMRFWRVVCSTTNA
jgi:hypothetical protein